MAFEERADGVRVEIPQRNQLEWRSVDIDSTLAPDHRARGIWEFVGELDLSRFYEGIRSRGSVAGRPATDPRVLLTLWLYATSEGIGSARQVERLCQRDDVYRWICGGVSVNYHTLSDFRVGHGEQVDELLTQVLAALMRHGLVQLKRVAQDGMRIRASAGAGSFRRRKSLEECLARASGQVAALREQIAANPAGPSRKEQAARERAAREREARVKQALREMPRVEEVKKRTRESNAKKKVSEPRVSTTDPDARVMKMADGGFRPAYNLQLATDVNSRVIVGVTMINNGSDKGQGPPMLSEVERRMGRLPKEELADGGYNDKKSIEEFAQRGVVFYAPVMEKPRAAANARSHHGADSEAVAEWRARMGTAEGQAIYKQRAATAETVNGDLRCWRGLSRLTVRGIHKVQTVALWSVLTYDILKALAVV
jgi:transposase